MKKYVKVIAVFHTDGSITPRVILSDDGAHMEINNISDIRRAASISAGGYGVRYTCVCGGRPLQIYLEGSRWFVENGMP